MAQLYEISDDTWTVVADLVIPRPASAQVPLGFTRAVASATNGSSGQ